MDARVALLETVLVLTTLHQGRVSGVTQPARTTISAKMITVLTRYRPIVFELI